MAGLTKPARQQGGEASIRARGLEVWLGPVLAGQLSERVEPVYTLGEWFRLTRQLVAFSRTYRARN